MKPSPFPEWMQLELNDVVQEGDTWQLAGCGLEPTADQAHPKLWGKTLQRIYLDCPGEMQFEMFRRGRRLLSGNPHFSKELPLP